MLSIPKQDFSFDPETHTYRLGDQILPSVTQIIQDAGLIDTSFYTPEHALRGQAVHLACELDDLGELDEESVDPQIAGYLEAWRSFRRQVKTEWELIEHRDYHPTFLFAGTVDRIGFVDGRLTILDIKTGVSVPSNAIQTAGYELLAEASFYQRMCVYLRDDGGWKIEQHTDKSDRHVFLSALNLVNWKRKAGLNGR